jgi:hypothetical protein
LRKKYRVWGCLGHPEHEHRGPLLKFNDEIGKGLWFSVTQPQSGDT